MDSDVTRIGAIGCGQLLNLLLARTNPAFAPKIASQHNLLSRNDTEQWTLPIQRFEQFWGNPMNSLPVDRALSIYGALADRSETKGAREGLSKHLMKIYTEGEKDEHRLTVHGLSYLRKLDQEIDSRN
jgi:hypothetical protein